jgi:hypothetical protein
VPSRLTNFGGSLTPTGFPRLAQPLVLITLPSASFAIVANAAVSIAELGPDRSVHTHIDRFVLSSGNPGRKLSVILAPPVGVGEKLSGKVNFNSASFRAPVPIIVVLGPSMALVVPVTFVVLRFH